MNYSKLLQIPQVKIIETVDNDRNFTLLFSNENGIYKSALRMVQDLQFNYSFWDKVSEKLKSIIYNEIPIPNKVFHTVEEINSFIATAYQYYSPNEKLINSLKYLQSRTNYDGQQLTLNFSSEIEQTELWRKFYFTNSNEFIYYLQTLRKLGYISYKGLYNDFVELYLTIEGLSELVKLNISENSRKCFVAMSFDASVISLYDQSIAPAIVESGFIPVIVKNVHVDSDKTINDAIIAEIKEARFVIADFTMHKAGVYFEAGYALGRGLKVIYTCKKDDIEKAHFDTRNFQHILWETGEDLKIQLINKINAFIKD